MNVKVGDANLTTLVNYFWKHYYERCLAAGIPPSFLGILVDDNRFEDAELEKFLDQEISVCGDELVEMLILWAQDVGVYGCDECSRYYTLAAPGVKIDRNGTPLCPHCGKEIRPACCAVCAENLIINEQDQYRFVGAPIKGYYLCPCCLAEAMNSPISKILTVCKTEGEDRMPRFLIVFKGNNVRDAQICIENNADVMDDDKWRSVEDCELVSGIVKAPTKEEAISSQAEVEGVEKDVLDAFELAGYETDFLARAPANGKVQNCDLKIVSRRI